MLNDIVKITIAILILMLLVNSCVIVNNQEFGYVKLVITEYNSGPLVQDATVTLYTQDGKITKISDENGTAIFESLKLNRPYKIEIEKENHARTVIDILSLHTSLNLNTTLRKSKFDNSAKSNMEISFKLFDSELKTSEYKPDKNGVYTINRSLSLYIEAQAKSDNVPITFIYAKIGNPPGAEALASPRLYASGNNLKGTVDTASFSGKTYLFLDCYDENDNRYELVVPLYFVSFINFKISPYYVEGKNPSIYAYNINTQIKYYTLSSKFSNAYVIISWKKWEDSSQTLRTDKPTGYAVYRSYDGKKYNKIAIVGNDTDSFIDSSGENIPGKRIWYAVSSVHGAIEGPKRVLGSVVILPLFSISDVQPSDNATNVSLTPTFSWRFVGLEDYDVTYWYEIWLYDMTVNRKYHYPVNSEGAIIFKSEDRDVKIDFKDYNWYGLTDNKLQANKPYEWAPELVAAEWRDEENNSLSLSIVSDYNGVISPMAVEPEKYYLFVTGGGE